MLGFPTLSMQRNLMRMKHKYLTVILLLFVNIGVILVGCKSRTAVEQKKLDIKLCQASLNGDLNQIKYLLPRGADPNTIQCGEYAKVGYPTPLFFALLGVKREVKDLLRQEGSSKYHSDDIQRLTIMALLAAGANPNTKSNTKAQETPLMYAEFLRASDIVRSLIEGGADPNIRDANGKVAKDYAELSEENNKNMASGHVVVRLVIAMADKEVVEKELIEEIVPNK
jgi:ankyrin repeat protein